MTLLDEFLLFQTIPEIIVKDSSQKLHLNFSIHIWV